MRELQHAASLKPSLGGGRVFVVRDAERLSLDAANCFLKTLEEPPPGCTLVLIASSLRDLPETVVSRCRVVRFHNMPPEALRERLEAGGMGADDAAWLARQSWGSPGTAEALLAAEVPTLNRELVERLAALSVEDNFALSDWLNSAADAGGGSATEKRTRLQDLLECVAAYYGDRAAQACRAGEAPDAFLRRAELALDAIDWIGANANRTLALDHLFTSLAGP